MSNSGTSGDDKDPRRRPRSSPHADDQPFQADALAYVTRRTIQILCKEDHVRPKPVKKRKAAPQRFEESRPLRKDVVLDLEESPLTEHNSALEFQKYWDLKGRGFELSEPPTVSVSASNSNCSESKVLEEFRIPVGSFPAPRLRQQRSSLDVGVDNSSVVATRQTEMGPDEIDNGSSSKCPSPNATDDAGTMLSNQKKRKRRFEAENEVSEPMDEPQLRRAAIKMLNEEIHVETLKEMVEILASFKEQHANSKFSKLPSKPCDPFRLSPVLSQLNVSCDDAASLPDQTNIKTSPSASAGDNRAPWSHETDKPLDSLVAPHMPDLQCAHGSNDTSHTPTILHDLLRNHSPQTRYAGDKQVELCESEPELMSTMQEATASETVQTDESQGGRITHDDSPKASPDCALPSEGEQLVGAPLAHGSKAKTVEGRIIYHELIGSGRPSGGISPPRQVKTATQVVLPAQTPLPVAEPTCFEATPVTIQASNHLRDLRNIGKAQHDDEVDFRKKKEYSAAEMMLQMVNLPETGACLNIVGNKASAPNDCLENNPRSTIPNEPPNQEKQPFSHALFSKQRVPSESDNATFSSKKNNVVSTENYENVVWIPHDPSEIILKDTEVELAWLCEESKYCSNQEDVSWEFVWEYASPTLKVEMLKFQREEGFHFRQLVRLDDPLVSRRFEAKREEIRKSLRTGIRRPVMSQVVAEMRLRGRHGKLNLISKVTADPLPPPAISRSKKSKKKNEAKKVSSTLPPKPIETNRLSAVEEEIAWLGEESFLLDPRQEGFNIEFIREHASPSLLEALERISSEAHRRWLPRLVRLHDPCVKMEFERKRDEIRGQLRAGFRRPQTKDVLPLIDVPLPIQVRVRESYLSAFRNQPLTSSELAKVLRNK